MEDWDEDNIDLLLFEYLEGKLSGARAKELEAKIAVDAGIRSELEHWKESFIQQDVYDTSLLEKSLLQVKGKAINPFAATCVFVGALVILLFSPLPVAIEKETTTLSVSLQTQTPNMVKDYEEANIQVYKPALKEKRLSQASPGARLPEKRHTMNAVPENNLSGNLSNLEILPLEPIRLVETNSTPPVLSISPIQGQQVKGKRIPAIKTYSRKEQRQIARMKERALQQRRANQFLKGRIPYVVPLHSNGF